MELVPDKRRTQRVAFQAGVTVQILAIDGTWRRTCTMRDVSDSGALLIVDGSLAGLELSEFFLSLSSTGLAYRRCEKSWVNGNQLGVAFIKVDAKPKRSPRKGRVPAGLVNNA